MQLLDVFVELDSERGQVRVWVTSGGHHHLVRVEPQVTGAKFVSLLKAPQRIDANSESNRDFETLSVRLREKDADIAAPSAIYVRKQ